VAHAGIGRRQEHIRAVTVPNVLGRAIRRCGEVLKQIESAKGGDRGGPTGGRPPIGTTRTRAAGGGAGGRRGFRSGPGDPGVLHHHRVADPCTCTSSGAGFSSLRGAVRSGPPRSKPLQEPRGTLALMVALEASIVQDSSLLLARVAGFRSVPASPFRGFLRLAASCPASRPRQAVAQPRAEGYPAQGGNELGGVRAEAGGKEGYCSKILNASPKEV
jgi:hypothetical protein